MHDGRIATAWANDSMPDAVFDEQGRQYIDIFLIAIHDNLFF